LFAINHAAAALAVKRRYPAAPLVWLLISVQLSELLWVVFNYLGVEHTTTSDVVRYVGDIQLSDIPWSHSIASGAGLALLAGLVLAVGLRRPVLGAAVGIAFALEFGFGLWCWWDYRGGRGLLAVIVLFNLANLSFFTPLIVGPEGMLAHRPTLIVTAILAQIVVTLTLVGLFARQPAGAPLAE
jgi:hypothetical protein